MVSRENDEVMIDLIDANECVLPIGNIVIIGLLIAAWVGYSAYQQKSGRTIAGKTK